MSEVHGGGGPAGVFKSMMNKALQTRVHRYMVFIVLVAVVVCTVISVLTYQSTLVSGENRHLCYGYYGDTVNPVIQGVKGHQSVQTNSSTDVAKFVTAPDTDVVESFTKWALSPVLLELGLSVLDAFGELAKEENVTWFIGCGTLLGSYRHHGMIPWDTDFDLLVRRADREKMEKAYSRLNSTKFGTVTNERWTKMYHKSAWKAPSAQWTFPQLDIFWINDNATHLWVNTEQILHSKDVVYPLVRRPFHGRMLLAPRDPRRALEQLYNKQTAFQFLDNCQTMTYDNLHESSKKSIIAPCAQLVNYFPFVRHIRGPGGAFCKEELEMSGQVIGSFTRSAKNIPVC